MKKFLIKAKVKFKAGVKKSHDFYITKDRYFHPLITNKCASMAFEKKMDAKNYIESQQNIQPNDDYIVYDYEIIEIDVKKED